MEKEKKSRKSVKNTITSWMKILDNNIYSFRYMWNNSKGTFLISVANALINGLMNPAVLLLNSRLYTLLGEQPFFVDALFVILNIAGVKILQWLWNLIFSNYLWPGFSQRMHQTVQVDLFKKVRTLELSKYDDPDFYNNFILAMQYADTYAAGTVGNFTSLIQYFLNFSATLALLVYIDFGTMALLLASAVISMVISTRRKKVDFAMRDAHAPVIRRGQYINKIFMLPDYAKELRLSQISECINREYEIFIKDHINVTKKYGKKQIGLDFLNELNSTGTYMAVIALTIYKLTLGAVTLGGFTVIINANWSFRSSLVSFADTISNLPQQSEQIAKVRRFMEYEPEGRGGTLEAPSFESMELKNVCFGYNPETEILHNISLKLRRGEKIAVVGYNGAGKSTLIKLLMHLYEPQSGTIFMNGVNINEYDTDSYRGRIGAVFQDFRIFAATIAENVLGDEFAEDDRARVLDALHRATFDGKLAELEQGIDTMLTREFDEKGTNISGGEAQKIAIARVFARPYDIIIMDEPSASLDPMAEYALNKQISAFAEDKTVIFISHRLSTTRHADRIYMFEDGRIAEEGSHDELMKLGGRYAEMFAVQAENYIK